MKMYLFLMKDFMQMNQKKQNLIRMVLSLHSTDTS